MNLLIGDRDDQPNFRIWHQHLYFSDDKYQKDSAGKSPGIACDIEIDIGFFLRWTKHHSKFQKKKNSTSLLIVDKDDRLNYSIWQYALVFFRGNIKRTQWGNLLELRVI